MRPGAEGLGWGAVGVGVGASSRQRGGQGQVFVRSRHVRSIAAGPAHLLLHAVASCAAGPGSARWLAQPITEPSIPWFAVHDDDQPCPLPPWPWTLPVACGAVVGRPTPLLQMEAESGAQRRPREAELAVFCVSSRDAHRIEGRCAKDGKASCFKQCVPTCGLAALPCPPSSPPRALGKRG